MTFLCSRGGSNNCNNTVSNVNVSSTNGRITFGGLVSGADSASCVTTSNCLRCRPVGKLVIGFGTDHGVCFDGSHLFAPACRVKTTGQGAVTDLSRSHSRAAGSLLRLATGCSGAVTRVRGLSLLLKLSRRRGGCRSLDTSNSSFRGGDVDLVKRTGDGCSMNNAGAHDTLHSLFNHIGCGCVVHCVVVTSFHCSNSSHFTGNGG